jgi:hypothetical protein
VCGLRRDGGDVLVEVGLKGRSGLQSSFGANEPRRRRAIGFGEPRLPPVGETDAFDRDVRLFVYRRFLAVGAPPSVADTAQGLGAGPDAVEASYRRLEAGHVLVLAPGTLNIWMANPLCAYPTPFWVETPNGAWWGTCVWDAFGIPAMLGTDATISTSCPDCGEALELTVEDGSLRASDGVAHFAVPARRWWENIGYT